MKPSTNSDDIYLVLYEEKKTAVMGDGYYMDGRGANVLL